MTRFVPHTPKTANAEGREILEGVKQKYGFVPNLTGNLVRAPKLAKGYLALGDLFSETSFDATEQQVILLAVSRYNECAYCVGAHSALAAMQQLPADVVESIRNDEPIADPQLEALRSFTTRVVDQRGCLSKEDLGDFIAAGYHQGQILEVILGVAMKAISNYANHVANTELDPAFAEFAWQKPEVNAA
jgi:uncharacterized peroxidase-related enzyme